jgi:hypothetical protein
MRVKMRVTTTTTIGEEGEKGEGAAAGGVQVVRAVLQDQPLTLLLPLALLPRVVKTR